MSRRFDRTRQFSANDQLPYIADTNDAAVELVGLDVNVAVTGLFAETTQTLRLYNPNQRDLEGNLCFPLPDGAVVCGYAIDVGGRLVDGVVVPKEEARRILEAEIRKGIDPGLVEQVQGNVYRTRIYPLPALGTRTIKLVYISRLSVDGNDAAYHLPLGHAEDVDDVSLHVEVSQSPVEPAVVGGLGNLTLTQFEQRWVADATLSNGTPTDDLQVRLPNLPDHVTAVERFGDQDFFCISSKTRRAEQSESWSPNRVAVLWDASGSRQNIDRDLSLLQELSEKWQHVTFDVRVLRDVVEPESRSFTVEAGDCGPLQTYLRGLPIDGGTHLAGVDLGDLPHAEDEAWLLFSDGLNTIGAGLPDVAARRVFAITGQANSDSALLNHVAQRSGGAYFNLLNTTPAKAADIIASWTDALRLEATAGCEDVHVAVSSGRLTIVGRLTEAMASVQLSGPGAPDDHLAVATASATTGRNLARAWAGQQAQLEKLLGSDPATVVELGQTYGLVTPGTSLLVLENLDQYLEYDIEPPASLPDLREQFHRLRRQTEQDEDERQASQIADVLSMWERRIQWWETDYAAQRARNEKQRRAAKIAEPEVDFGELNMAPPGAAPDGYGAPRSAAAQTYDMRADSDDEPEMLYRLESAPAAAPMMEESAAVGGGFSREMADPEREADEIAFGEGGGGAKESASSGAQASVQIQPWSPDTPYLTAMKGADDAYASYLDQRAGFALSPAFFLDCSDFLFKAEQPSLALRVLSNLLELALDDPALLRMYAWRMQQADELDEAIHVLERVLAKRDDEPQSHRDLALALEQRWQRDGDEADAVRAMELLYAVIKRTWDRFPEIEIIALVELNRLIHLAKLAGIEAPSEIDSRLIRLLDLDVRISMSWDADLTDVDLHVFEPTGEHAYYAHNQTEIGGLVSRDFREGYGPEEYVLRRAEPGDYTIKTHYYGSHQQTIAGACTVIVTVFTNYARPNETKQVLTLRLEQASDQVVVGTINIGGEANTGNDWEAVFRSLTKGMSVDEIVGVVGQPDELGGSDEMLLVYRPVDGVEIHVYAAPRLTSVQLIMDGATLDLV